ncbi:hypothetical protein F5Y12DRAFT_776019 [Xylaria sp. FL1777]|nr:hypothetical protein F5Y12DRAFT_776019 [Xylaria sp. FL1777]
MQLPTYGACCAMSEWYGSLLTCTFTTVNGRSTSHTACAYTTYFTLYLLVLGTYYGIGSVLRSVVLHRQVHGRKTPILV